MTFNPDNCGLRLIPSTAIDNWISEIGKKDSNMQKYLHIQASKLYEASISPTEEQFLAVLGNQDIEFEEEE